MSWVWKVDFNFRSVEDKTIKRLAANKQRCNEHFPSSVLNSSATEENMTNLS